MSQLVNFKVVSQNFRHQASGGKGVLIRIPNHEAPEIMIDRILDSLGDGRYISQIYLNCYAISGFLSIGNTGLASTDLVCFQRLSGRFAIEPISTGQRQRPSIILWDKTVASNGSLGAEFMNSFTRWTGVAVRAGTIGNRSGSIVYCPNGQTYVPDDNRDSSHPTGSTGFMDLEEDSIRAI